MANCLFERYQASNVKYEAAKLCLKSIKTEMITLLGIITVGLLTTGKNKNQEKMAKLSPHYPGQNFTSAKPFNFKIAKYTKITEIEFNSTQVLKRVFLTVTKV